MGIKNVKNVAMIFVKKKPVRLQSWHHNHHLDVFAPSHGHPIFKTGGDGLNNQLSSYQFQFIEWNKTHKVDK